MEGGCSVPALSALLPMAVYTHTHACTLEHHKTVASGLTLLLHCLPSSVSPMSHLRQDFNVFCVCICVCVCMHVRCLYRA